MKNKVNEWQELSLKKDIEKISRSLSQQQTVGYSIIFDLFLAITSVLIDKMVVDGEQREQAFWVLITICILAFVVQVMIFTGRAVKRHNTKYKVFSPDELIDSFDNEICYYVMMADTYNQMLQDAAATTNAGITPSNIAIFYYIETWYYINKAKAQLANMQYKISDVFTNDSFEIARNNGKILLSRLKNLTLIMEDIRISTNTLITNKQLIITDSSILKINADYDQYYKTFVLYINKGFGQTIHIDFDDPDRFPQ